ncbi:MAG: hypothetical protein F6K42_04720 [Leptolyngbya sp. SIO1D8]|nr:hypothetical protein [Leptolyngbya sp. SIO1D8]
MIRQRIRGLLTLLIALLFAVGLTSCNGLSASPPQTVVTQAVMVQAQSDQQALWQQLSLQSEATPSLSVSQVKIRQTRPVQVMSDLAYEIEGTYQYKLRYPNRRRIQQSQVPFTIVLRVIPDTEDWQLLQREKGVAGDRAWFWKSLSSNSA